jgi:energy-coupling factor transport system substrate-specific component
MDVRTHVSRLRGGAQGRDGEPPQHGWRVVDMVVASVLAVAGGLLLWVFGLNYATLGTWPPASALLNGLFVLPGVLGALVVRRPGAAVYTELVAATVSALLGNQWGFSTVYYGLLEGLGAELVFAALLYRRFGLGAALLGGAGAGVVMGLLDVTVYYSAFGAGDKLGYVVVSVLSSVVLAGAVAWALTRALARTGALAPLASGRAAERV